MNYSLRRLSILIAIMFAAAGASFAQLAPTADIVKISAALSVNKLAAGSRFKLAVLAQVKDGMHVNASGPDAGIPPKIRITAGQGVKFGVAKFPPPEKKKFAFSEKPIPVYEGKFRIIIPGQVARNAKAGPRTINISLTYQACDDNTCYPPGEAVTRLRTKVASSGTAKSVNAALFCETSPKSGQPSGITGRLLGALHGSNPLLATLISFLLGVGLCLTPCVYPMIPITVGFFAGQSAGRRRRVFSLALFYVLGIAITYSVLGFAAAYFGLMVGSLLQNPLAVGAIAAVLLVLSLSMFGLFSLQPPAFIMNRSGARSGAVGALLMGLMLGLVASPCIGPAVAGVAVWVTQLRNPLMGFWIFFSLALGLGIPFMALAVFSGGISRLPRAGEWMASIKKISGIALLGASLYFARTLFPETIRDYVMPAFLFGVAVYLTTFKSSLSLGRATFFARPMLGVATVLLGLWSLTPHSPSQHMSWEPYTEQALADAARDGRPVIIDFTAAWCQVCKELDDHTFSDLRVVRSSCSFVLLRADLTRKSSATDTLTKRFKVRGLPTVVFIDSHGAEVRDKRVIGFVKPSDFAERMSAVE